MKFNASEEWLRKMAEAEDNVNVCIGPPPTAEDYDRVFGDITHCAACGSGLTNGICPFCGSEV